MKTIIRRPDGTLRVGITQDPNIKERTKQQFKDQCDINNIMKKYLQSGELTHIARSQGVYADVSEITDYEQSLNKIAKANEAFMTLPAKVRERFANNPAKFLEFMQDPNNYKEGVELGLYERPIATNNNDDSNDDDTKQKATSKSKPTTSSSEGSNPPKED